MHTSQRPDQSQPACREEMRRPASATSRSASLAAVGKPLQGFGPHRFPWCRPRGSGVMPGIILSRSSLNLSHPSLWKWRKRVVWKRFPQRLDEIKPIGNRKLGSVSQQTLDIAHKPSLIAAAERPINRIQFSMYVRPSLVSTAEQPRRAGSGENDQPCGCGR